MAHHSTGVTASEAPSVPDRVRSIATLRRRTQADLADSLGLSRQAIVRRMNGTTPFSEPELRNLASYLSVPVGAFFGEAVAS